MKKTVYVLVDDEEVTCYTSLSKLIRNAPKVTYYPVYRYLKNSNRLDRNGYTIIRTTLS